jgi:ketosteroid isomerase-like protein
VREFFAAHVVRDADTASSFLTEDAVVVDQGETFRCREEVHAFLRDAGSEFEYTTEQIGTRRVDDAHWVVTVRLEGTFPGGVAELDYRFALRDGLVAELVIANHTA